MIVKEIPLDRLIPSRNLRTESGDAAELVESIREHGLLQPILVRPVDKGLFQIIAGHRRFLAHRILGKSTISAIMVEETDEAAAVQSIVENLQRENLTPLELARGIRELLTAFNLTPEQIGKAISKSPAQVRNWIRLSRLPDDVLGSIESGEGRQQIVSGITPRHIQPFVSDLPSEEEVVNDPESATRYRERIDAVREFQKELDTRGVHINVYLADEIARRVKKDQVTVAEAIDAVLANPEKYRPSYNSSLSPQELEQDTWDAYKHIHDEMRTLAHRLRPEIAVLFRPEQKHDLLERLLVLQSMLELYGQALRDDRTYVSITPPQLAQDQSKSE